MKKLLIALTMTISAATYANTGAVDSFLSVANFGEYNGKTPAGHACQVYVSKVSDDTILISAQVSSKQVMKVITNQMEYFFKAFKSEFIQTERKNIDSTSYYEKILRTTIAGQDQLYVVISNDVVLNRVRQSNLIECVINL